MKGRPMKHLFAILIVLMPLAVHGQEKSQALIMNAADRFTVADTAKWSVSVEKLQPLRFADVKVKPKKDSSFSLMLYFKSDTPDVAQLNSPEKIEQSVKRSSEQYLSGAVEKKIELKKLKANGGYGCYAVFTDAKLAQQTEIPKGQFKYVTRGMVRVSPYSALGFTLMSNDLDGPQYNEVFNYILSFVKPKK
jgi:hypothetical protein